ncbi:MAG: MFS transporter [Parachlamydiales bacterium]|nr:MFS transporter [Parachlamydiales bacterium]
MIHTTIDTRKAKFLYGLMFGIGGLGSIVGGVVSGFFAVDLKSQNLFLFSIPLYLIVFAFYNLALKNSKVPKNDFKEMIIEENTNPKEAFSLIKKNNFLTYVLLIVVFMQVSTAFLDYQYNVFLERTIPDIDLRTAYTGKITSLINSITTCFQFFGGFILIHFLGLKRSHLIVPILLGLNSLAFFFFPFFSMAVFAFVSIKSLDYSLFAIVREMLYIPLKIDEKYRAKALIDVFAYRAAKAFSSLFLIFIQNLSGLNIILLISIISMIIYAFWINVVTLMFKKHKQFIFQKE